MKRTLLFLALSGLTVAAQAQIQITEWMYNGADGEFVEFTNVGGTAIDMTGWSFDDNSRTPGVTDLSAFGMVEPGHSVIMCEPTASEFATAWGLMHTTIVGENGANLGRADEINLFDGAGVLVDRLTYDDANGLGPRTSEISGNIPLNGLGANNANLAVLSMVGDTYGSWAAVGGSVGNPGQYTPVPEPATMAVLGLGVAALLRRRRK